MTRSPDDKDGVGLGDPSDSGWALVRGDAHLHQPALGRLEWSEGSPLPRGVWSRLRAVLVAGLHIGLLGAVDAVFGRVSVLLLLLGALAVLAWTAIGHPDRIGRRVRRMWALALLLLVAPVDVWRGGDPEFHVRFLPVVWGYPLEETARRMAADEVLAGGCFVPLNPPSYVLEVSW